MASILIQDPGTSATADVGKTSVDRERPSLSATLRRTGGNVLPAGAWLFLLYMQVLRFSFPPALPNLLMAAVNSVHVAVFLCRRDSRENARPQDMCTALAGTALIAFLPQATHASALSTSIQVLGLVCWLLSLMALGRSFGIAAADRGLKVGGPYSLVRHPIYASEFVFYGGMILAEMTLNALAIFVLWAVIQVLRMVLEENAIEGYGTYKQRVRWRVLPGVW